MFSFFFGLQRCVSNVRHVPGYWLKSENADAPPVIAVTIRIKAMKAMINEKKNSNGTIKCAL